MSAKMEAPQNVSEKKIYKEELSLFCASNEIPTIDKATMNNFRPYYVQLGVGSHGMCWRVPMTDADYVLKQVVDNDFSSVAREITFLHQVQGIPGVQKLVGVRTKHKIIVSEYAGPPLSLYFNGKTVSYDVMTSFMVQLGRIIMAVNERDILHNKITDSNICM